MKTLLGIEITDEEFDYLFCEQAKGKEIKVKDGRLVAEEHVVTEKEKALIEIERLKIQLEKYKEDVEQVELFGMEREDYIQKRQECANIILQLRELENSLKEDSNG